MPNEPIPSVDPEDIKGMHEFDRTHSRVGADGWRWLQDRQAVCSPGADISAVSSRCAMVATMSRYNHGQLVAPWLHGETLDDSVFRIAATFPLRQVKQHDYKIGGDELFGFDLNAFVQRLIDETGIPHVWERVLTAIPEGRRMYTYSSSHFPGQEPDPELDGKRLVRNLAWNIWKRFSPNLDEMLLSHCDKERASEIVATRFADFLLNNLDLVRQIESTFWIDGPAAFELAKELERRAQGGSSAGNAN